jgi:hypothetical protein
MTESEFGRFVGNVVAAAATEAMADADAAAQIIFQHFNMANVAAAAAKIGDIGNLPVAESHES